MKSLSFTYERPTARASDSFSKWISPARKKSVSRRIGAPIQLRSQRQGEAFIITHSDISHTPTTEVVSKDGQVLYRLPKVPSPWDSLTLPEFSWEQVTAEDGTALNGILLRPSMKREKRFPVIVYVYGGPTAQLVTNGFGTISPLSVYLTQQGFGVFILDNRGTGNRNRAFSRSIYQRVADIDVVDQLAGVNHLSQIDGVDKDRIGVWGWSYGGTMASLLITAPESPFAAALAGAPVTDWRLYDTHYTERYLGTPQEHPEVYEKTDITSRAKNLNKPFLLVHGTADDNVLFENSLRFIEALQDESAPFELMIYPGHAHGLRGRTARLHFSRMLVKFFARELKNPVNSESL